MRKVFVNSNTSGSSLVAQKQFRRAGFPVKGAPSFPDRLSRKIIWNTSLFLTNFLSFIFYNGNCEMEVSCSGVDIYLYIDVIFFVNFFMDFLLLYMLKGFLKRPAGMGRLVWAGVIGGIFGCAEVLFWKLPHGIVMAASFGAAGLMVRTAYRPGDWRELVKETGSLYLLAMLAGGAMEFLCEYTGMGFYAVMIMQGQGGFMLPFFMWLFLIAGACLLALGLGQFAREMTKERKNRYLAVLRDGETWVEVSAFLDTGNFLTEPGSGKGVQIVTERIWKLFDRGECERVMIPYHTIGNPLGSMEGIRIESMEIFGVGRGVKKGKVKIMKPWIARAPYGLTRNGSYEVLLHGETAMLEEEKTGGITSGD